MNSSTATPSDHEDKDAPLRHDIRLLGRILGETLRDQDGDEAFEIVERIRQLAISFHRDQEQVALAGLEQLFHDLPNGRITYVARAFSYFSHLANIAEDQHHIRRARAHLLAGSPARATRSISRASARSKARRLARPVNASRLDSSTSASSALFTQSFQPVLMTSPRLPP
jgi:phosphoenolpyruvate carboxylase